MPNSRRRNKRNNNILWDSLSNETVKKIILVCIPIICICLVVLTVKTEAEKREKEAQRVKLEQEIAAIFEVPSMPEEKEESSEIEQQIEDTTITIAMTGDILCGEEILKDGKTSQGYDFSHQFQNIQNLIQKSDIAIGTMETNFTNNSYSGYKKYNSPVEFAEAVKQSGIGIVSLAHNHSLDYGIEGLTQTKEILEKMQIQTTGANMQNVNQRYLVQNIKGIKVAFLAYTYGFSNEEELSTQWKQNVNIYEEKAVKQDLENAKKEADFICVIMHWGDINSNQVSAEQTKIADFLVANGAGAIIGSHPAVVEPMQMKQNSEGENVLVAYSLGNYISSLGYENSNLELILNVELTKEGKTGKVSISKVTYTPIYVLDKGSKAPNRFHLIDMRQTAKEYLAGENKEITKAEYNKILKGLDKLEEIIRK